MIVFILITLYIVALVTISGIMIYLIGRIWHGEKDKIIYYDVFSFVMLVLGYLLAKIVLKCFT